MSSSLAGKRGITLTGVGPTTTVDTPTTPTFSTSTTTATTATVNQLHSALHTSSTATNIHPLDISEADWSALAAWASRVGRHSFANVGQWRCGHVYLEGRVDFPNRTIHGAVVLHLSAVVVQNSGGNGCSHSGRVVHDNADKSCTVGGDKGVAGGYGFGSGSGSGSSSSGSSSSLLKLTFDEFEDLNPFSSRDYITLDTSGQEIDGVFWVPPNSQDPLVPLSWNLGPQHSVFGRPLVIRVPNSTQNPIPPTSFSTTPSHVNPFQQQPQQHHQSNHQSSDDPLQHPHSPCVGPSSVLSDLSSSSLPPLHDDTLLPPLPPPTPKTPGPMSTSSPKLVFTRQRTFANQLRPLSTSSSSPLSDSLGTSNNNGNGNNNNSSSRFPTSNGSSSSSSSSSSSNSNNDSTGSMMIRIQFRTSPTASGLQWLEPSQTAGGKFPYLFSQCQAIHARSILPIQDTPVVKSTFSARIRVPEPFVVVMGAIAEEVSSFPTVTDALEKVNLSSSSSTSLLTKHFEYRFHQPTPIPSYLFALAVGDLKSAPIGPRSRVWTEPKMLEACTAEFGDCERQLETLERLLRFPYVWGTYDVLVLPPSFPYGGMENPNLTFATPTLLTGSGGFRGENTENSSGAKFIPGDRSLTDVIVHEMAHSWSGNLVTAGHWSSFWLNEGLTVYLERAAVSVLNNGGEPFRHLSAYLGLVHLENDVKLFESQAAAIPSEGDADHIQRKRDQVRSYATLNPQIEEVDPDDAFSSVPYERGAAFLMFLEQNLFASNPIINKSIHSVGGGGGDKNENDSHSKPTAMYRVLEFLHDYFRHFQSQSIDTGDFRAYLDSWITQNGTPEERERYSGGRLIDWDAWLNGAGVGGVKGFGMRLPVEIHLDRSLVDRAERIGNRFHEWAIHQNHHQSELDSSSSVVPVELLQWTASPNPTYYESESDKGSSSSPSTVSWRTNEFLVFLEYLIGRGENKVPVCALDALGRAIGFPRRYNGGGGGESSLSPIMSTPFNAETRLRWYSLCLMNGKLDVLDEVIQFLGDQGRMKFVRPLYRLVRTVDPERARLTFLQFRDRYHPIAARQIERDLQI